MYLLIDPREVQKSHKGSIFRFLEKNTKKYIYWFWFLLDQGIVLRFFFENKESVAKQ